jgi:hypothetical protein
VKKKKKKKKREKFSVNLRGDTASGELFLIIKHVLCVELVVCVVALGGLVVSVLATGPKVRGFKPGRGR